MFSKFLYLKLLVAIIFKDINSGNSSLEFQNILFPKFDNACFLFESHSNKASLSKSTILAVGEVIWKAITLAPEFRDISKKDNLEVFFKKYRKVLKKIFLSILEDNYPRLEESTIYKAENSASYKEVPDFDYSFFYNIYFKTFDIIRSLNFCYKERIIVANFQQKEIREIFKENLCFESNGKNNLPNVYYKWCEGIVLNLDKCIKEKYKSQYLLELRYNQKEILCSECGDNYYYFANMNPDVASLKESINNTDKNWTEVSLNDYCIDNISLSNINFTSDNSGNSSTVDTIYTHDSADFRNATTKTSHNFTSDISFPKSNSTNNSEAAIRDAHINISDFATNDTIDNVHGLDLNDIFTNDTNHSGIISICCVVAIIILGGLYYMLYKYKKCNHKRRFKNVVYDLAKAEANKKDTNDL
ncbi:uncharacterized protein VNE69_01024 [Vairimorpha necatrix]|uniref:Membrane protein n=2 Tax=Vairimorpha necatrix TaxID=6039 RepID=A0AAX4J7U0_9MICR